MEQEIYRLKEFCQKYAISKTSLYREINANRLETFKRGRLTFIARAEAERWFHCLAYCKTKETMDSRYSAASEKLT
ncbi:MAG: hypothetical protein P4N59_05635 [Negativicutes bacterium]|nr:hypothetical protein [Negativicutes bacterium]